MLIHDEKKTFLPYFKTLSEGMFKVQTESERGFLEPDPTFPLQREFSPTAITLRKREAASEPSYNIPLI